MNWNNIKTIVINLPKDTARRAFMEEELARLHIPFDILPATDGRTHGFENEYDMHAAIEKNGRPLTPPELGCALSHKRALEIFLASEADYGLIMEDDIEIDPSFPEHLANAIASRNNEWTYLQFNYSPVGWQGVRLWWFLLIKSRAISSPLSALRYLIKGVAANAISLAWGVRNTIYLIAKKGAACPIVRDQYLAGCYLLTKDAARALIALNTPFAYAADRVQNIARKKGKIRHRVYVPRLVRQKRESFPSSINNAHFGVEIISA
jgi:GR25 family glycosyltransferase involved in LPS biosynthesis